MPNDVQTRQLVIYSLFFLRDVSGSPCCALLDMLLASVDSATGTCLLQGTYMVNVSAPGAVDEINGVCTGVTVCCIFFRVEHDCSFLALATFWLEALESSVPLAQASLPLATFDWFEALEFSVPLAQVS
jgi:hypothetical protein